MILVELVPTKRYDATASCSGCQGSYVLGQSESCGIACKVILLSLLKYKVANGHPILLLCFGRCQLSQLMYLPSPNSDHLVTLV